MKKVLLIILISFLGRDLIGQAITKRAGASVTVNDENLFVGKSFRVPVFTDTTAANAAVTLDSSGKLIFTYDVNGLWIRQCSPKKWVRVGSGSGSGGGIVSLGNVGNYGLILVNDSTYRVDTLAISTRAWRQKGMDSLLALIGGKLNISDTTNKWVNTIYRKPGQDSFFFNKGGTEYGVKDSTGGGSTSVSGDYLGLIYSGKVGTMSLSDFTNNASVTDSAGHFVFSGGTSIFTPYLGINVNQRFGLTDYFTNPERWRIAVRAKVITTGLIMIGLKATTINSSTNNMFAYLNTADGGSNFNGQSATNLTITPGDVVEVIAERDVFKCTISVRNVTTNSATITTTNSYPVQEGINLPVTGKLAIFNYSGKYYIDSIYVNSYQPRNVDLLVIGDSKVQGYNGNSLTRFTTQLGNNYNIISYGGGFETTADWLTTVNDVLSLNPTNILLTNPSNDLRTGVNVDSTKARYYRIEAAFRAAGINVYHADAFYETSQTNATWASYIQSSRSADSVILTYATTASVAGYLSSDAVHPSNFGDSLITGLILSSGLIKASINLATAPNKVIQNQADFVQNAAFNISGISKVNNRFIIGKASLENSLRSLSLFNGTNVYTHFGAASGENNIISADSAETTFKKLNIKGSAIDLITNDGSNHTSSFATNGDVTFPRKLNAGASGLSGNVVMKITGEANETVQYFYNGATNNLWFADNGLSDGRLGVIRGKNLTLGTYNGSTYDALSIASSGSIGINKSAPSFGFDINRKVGLNKDSIPISSTNLSALSLDTVTNQMVRTVSAAANLGNSDLTQTGGNRTFTGAGQNLIFNGSGGTSLFNVEYNSIILTAQNSGVNIQGDSILISANVGKVYIDSLPPSIDAIDSVVVITPTGQLKQKAQSDLVGGLLSGTYTPTLTNVANVAASTAYSCQYSRVGTVVTVSGEVDIDPTTTLTLTQLGISLPIASNLTATNELGGTSADDLNTAARVAGDATNNRAEIRMTPVDVTNRRFSFTFTYRVL